jgi:hypothetical protein
MRPVAVRMRSLAKQRALRGKRTAPPVRLNGEKGKFTGLERILPWNHRFLLVADTVEEMADFREVGVVTRVCLRD